MDFESPLAGGLVLQFFDFLITEFFHMAALQADNMIVMAAFAQFEYGLAAFEMVAHQQPGLLELCQYAVNGSEADIISSVDHHFIHILGGKVTLAAFFKQLQNFQARQSGFEAGVFQVFLVMHVVNSRGIPQSWYINAIFVTCL